MKYIFLLIFLPLFSFAQYNNQMLKGQWIKAKAEMKDGSRIVDHNDCGMEFLKYTFIDDNTVDFSADVLFEGYRVPYRLTGDTLVLGGTIYNVVSFTKDTLKLTYFVFGAEDSQLPLYYFVKTQEHKVPAKATFDASIKDSVYQATNQLFPQCKGNLGTLMQVIDGGYDNGTIKASFVVDKKGRMKNFTVLEMDSVKKSFTRIVGNGFGYIQWLPAKQNNVPVNTIVQVTLKTSQKPYGGRIMNTLKIEYPFLPKGDYEELDATESEEAQRLFKLALNQSNNQNFEKALELLNKCIEIDKIYLNAYSLRAMVHTYMGKNKEACNDWTILAGLGQVSAKKKLAKCKN